MTSRIRHIIQNMNPVREDESNGLIQYIADYAEELGMAREENDEADFENRDLMERMIERVLQISNTSSASRQTTSDDEEDEESEELDFFDLLSS